MKRNIIIFIVITAFSLGIFAPSVFAASDSSLVGSWLLVFNYRGNIMMHDMVISQQDPDGNLIGTGGYPRGEEYAITWILKESKIDQDNVDLKIFFDNSDYEADLTGVLQPDGMISGTWSDNREQEGNWSADSRILISAGPWKKYSFVRAID